MSKRTSIVRALTEKFKEIDGNSPYTTNIYGQAHAKLEFWDTVNNFPSVYLTPGTETREYLPSNFAWGYLNVAVKVYCKGDNSQEELEELLEDLEHCIDSNRVLIYNQVNSLETTEILITSITTDEGLLAPYAIGEINLQIRYEVM